MRIGKQIGNNIGICIGKVNPIGGGVTNFDFASTTDTTQNWSIKLPVGKTMRIWWGDGNYDDYNGNGATSIAVTHTYAGSGTYAIQFSGDYVDLTYLQCSSNSLTGDVSGWSALTSLTTLLCNINSLTGDVSGWSALTSLTTLWCNTNSLTGDVSGWSALTSLTTLYCYSNSLTGDVSGWSALTSLTNLRCNSNSLTGDVSGWSALTSLTYLDCSSNNLDFNSLTSWTDHNHTFNASSNSMTSTQVDNILIAASAGSFSNKTITLHGTNAARTSASDAAVATLEAAGNTIITTA